MNWLNTNIWLYLTINIFDLWVIIRYYRHVLQTKEKKRICYVIYGIFLILFTFLIQYQIEYANIVSIAMWSCMFLPMYCGNKKRKALYALILLVFAGFSQMLMYFMVQGEHVFVYSCFIPHFTFFIVLELAGRYQTVREGKLDRKVLLILISVPLLSFVAMPCVVMLVQHMEELQGSQRTSMLIPVAVLILYVNIMIFYLYDRLSSVYEVEREKTEYQQQLLWQQKYYETMEENYNAIRKIKHDMKNNLLMVRQLAGEGRDKELQVYLEELLEEGDEVLNFVSTGNTGLDTILNIKISRAQKHGISIRRDISIPANLDLPYRHCIRIFGNLLDNAINAIEKSKCAKKEIYLFMTYQQNTLVVQISNQYDKEAETERTAKSITAKEQKDKKVFHGLGIKIVKATVMKYQGSYHVEDDGSQYTVNIMLYFM